MHVEGKWRPLAQAPAEVTFLPSRYDAAIYEDVPIPGEAVTVPVIAR